MCATRSSRNCRSQAKEVGGKNHMDSYWLDRHLHNVLRYLEKQSQLRRLYAVEFCRQVKFSHQLLFICCVLDGQQECVG